MKFKNLKIRTQLGIAFAVAVIPLIVMAVVPILMLGSINDTAQKLVNRYVPMLHSANDLVNDLGKTSMAFQDLLNTAALDKVSQQAAINAFAATDNNFSNLADLVESAGVPPELSVAYDSVKIMFNKLLSLPVITNNNELLEEYLNENAEIEKNLANTAFDPDLKREYSQITKVKQNYLSKSSVVYNASIDMREALFVLPGLCLDLKTRTEELSRIVELSSSKRAHTIEATTK